MSDSRLDSIPESCDCLWAISDHADGSRSGHIHIASKRCQQFLMHPRIFYEPPRDDP